MVASQAFRFTQLPTPAVQDDYDRARQWIIEYISHNQDVVALVEYGTVSVSGISDLDLIAVIADKPKGPNLRSSLFPAEVPASVSRFLDGELFKIVSVRHYRSLNLFRTVITKVLAGCELPIGRISAQEMWLLLVADLMDWLPERILMLMEIERSRDVSVTYFLGHLKSFCICVENAAEVAGSGASGAASYCDQVHQLRREWFNTDLDRNLKRMVDLTYEGIDLGRHLMNEVADFVVGQGLYTPTLVEYTSFFYLNSAKGYVFPGTEEGSKDEVPIERVIVETPGVWLTHLLRASWGSGFVSQLVARNLRIKGVCRVGRVRRDLAKLVDRRTVLGNEMVAYARQYGLEKGLYRYGHLRRV